MFKKSLSRRILCVLGAALLAVTATCVTLAGCGEKRVPLSFLTAEGDKVVNEEGKAVQLRGVNAGGLCVIEPWMNGFAYSSSENSEIDCRDHKTVTLEFIERFGEENTKKLWAEYQSNWWSEEDFKNCADMGMNVIRLPFTYMNVDFEAVIDYGYAGHYDFSYLDWFVETAEKYGLYTILDLHGAYGSQNGRDHSGEDLPVGSIDFYSNEEMLTLTAELWRALAEHFAGNSAVAGYDLLNEPGEKRNDNNDVYSTEKRHWDALDIFYKAVREVDQAHMVIFESCWEASNLPKPSEYGWENCMYSFHHYSGQTNTQSHAATVDSKIRTITAANFGVPIYMGEFTCYANDESWEYTLNIMNEYGWHWTSWTYKLNATYESAWGILNIVTPEEDKVNAHEDDYQTIIEKFRRLKTTEQTKKSELWNGTLWEVISKYCKPAAPVEGENDE